MKGFSRHQSPSIATMGSTMRSIDLNCDPKERESLLATIDAVAPSGKYFAL